MRASIARSSIRRIASRRTPRYGCGAYPSESSIRAMAGSGDGVRVPRHARQRAADVELRARDAGDQQRHPLHEPHARRAVHPLDVELDFAEAAARVTHVQLVERRMVELLVRAPRGADGLLPALAEAVVLVESVLVDDAVRHPAPRAAELLSGAGLDEPLGHVETAVRAGHGVAGVMCMAAPACVAGGRTRPAIESRPSTRTSVAAASGSRRASGPSSRCAPSADREKHRYRADPEREHDSRAGDGAPRPSRRHDEGVEPAAGKQRGEQARVRRSCDGRLVAQREDHGTEPPLQPRRRERERDAHAERRADRRGRPRDHQGARQHRGAAPDAREPAEVVDAGADGAGGEAERNVGDEAPAVVREVRGQSRKARPRRRSRVRAHEAAAHRRAVDASHQAGEEHSGEQRHEPAAGCASTRDVAVKWSDPRLTSNRSSHRPP